MLMIIYTLGNKHVFIAWNLNLLIKIQLFCTI